MHGLVQLIHRPSIFSLEIVKHAYRNRNRGGFSFALRPRSRGPLSLSRARSSTRKLRLCTGMDNIHGTGYLVPRIFQAEVPKA